MSDFTIDGQKSAGQKQTMKIGIACGGTGGHIFPGLATAEVLRRRGHDVVLWLAGKDVESTAVDGWEGPIVTIQADGVSSLFSLRNVRVGWRMVRAIRQCRQTMKDHQPEVLLAMGSYASIAPVWAARTLRVPVVLHEANVIPGRAICFLSRWATAVAIGFDETRQHLKHRRLVLTGMPLWKSGQRIEITTSPRCGASGPLSGSCRTTGEVRGQGAGGRDQMLAHHSQPLRGEGGSEASSQQWSGLKPDRFTVLVMGGSRGAHHLNELASAAVICMHQKGMPVQVIHLTGLTDEPVIRKQYEQAGVSHVVFGFLHDMAQAYRRAALAVCRSGASSCAELACYGIPALLVPYPRATHQHQLANARAVETAGAADIRIESELSVEWLADYLAAQMADPVRLERLKQVACRRHGSDAAEALADLVEQVGLGKAVD
ncbi:MAG: UDP-N-acetylglucosamine--N-acetylmuramyl-(pentapeptide) pyrophosphoryl-undecaprenol N-acetylglucosamine transferase [Verrucomicrobia bacterium]|nr:UDP-N-acetylglucosamine--N-acetylmuramyl-(pentapeptide) pyrophosphoryl-undecaprenol N-acetylglucosamine transferase [Verrucomicrobiota bacterium]MBU4248592.1 UDP-N-acetylglucosamine--N-acetylmuramyl-(pentapeptide) pyrophosphoryl-undecaprenol N-acetylglucosamine transferase [Verrucomicrobiota bacterium]MBU4290532.1 UDP-N-acetylglucosamine--N-acetylmuramyl-(pentapeptide) pyrophosphoryl-undecaprenol N-acetylglucosamine transferase [Verrucomicrobiota bacterium]MBU4429145.1 UDP-N-acetylglucosamine